MGDRLVGEVEPRLHALLGGEGAHCPELQAFLLRGTELALQGLECRRRNVVGDGVDECLLVLVRGVTDDDSYGDDGGVPVIVARHVDARVFASEAAPKAVREMSARAL